MERTVAANLALDTREAIGTLERFFTDTRTDLRTWSDLRVMQDVLIDDEEGEIGADLGGLTAQYGHFAELAVLNAAGRVVASTDHADLGMDLSESPLFSAIVRGQGFQG